MSHVINQISVAAEAPKSMTLGGDRQKMNPPMTVFIPLCLRGLPLCKNAHPPRHNTRTLRHFFLGGRRMGCWLPVCGIGCVADLFQSTSTCDNVFLFDNVKPHTPQNKKT